MKWAMALSNRLAGKEQPGSQPWPCQSPAESGWLQEEVGWCTSQQLFLGCLYTFMSPSPLMAARLEFDS